MIYNVGDFQGFRLITKPLMSLLKQFLNTSTFLVYVSGGSLTPDPELMRLVL